MDHSRDDRTGRRASVSRVGRPHGIIPALVTPFDEEGQLDLAALGRTVERLLGCGVHGLFVAGSQGEFYALSQQEYERIVAEAVRVAAGRVPVYAGASAIATHQAIELARVAEAAGVDAITVLPPFFIKPSQTELESHFAAVAAAVRLPLILYNQPQRTGVSLSTELVAALAQQEQFVAVKDSSGDMNQSIAYISATPKDFTVLIGNDAQIAYGMFAGANGAISATANVVPELCLSIYRAALEGQIESARSLQEDLAHLRSAFELGTFPVVVKEAMALLGYAVGPCRAPVAPLSAQARERLRETLCEIKALAPVEVSR